MEVPDYLADPYASFLSSISTREYHERLAERGMKPKGEPDRGHSFNLRRFSYGMTSYRGGYNGTRRNTWAGPVNAYPASAGVHNGSDISPSTVPSGLESFAQQAYSRAAPTAVVFDAAQFLGELREGLPSLFLTGMYQQAKKFKGAGSEYLNVEFGWKPFLNDLWNAIRVLINYTDSVSVKNGARVHRRYAAMPSMSSSSISGIAEIQTRFPRKSSLIFGSYDTMTNASMGFNASFNAQKTRTVNRWFEGEFTSFLSLGFDPSNYFDRVKEMSNIELTPAVLWELAPWSWLVDWYLRIGDSIAANEIGANDKLIMHYGYAMEHVVDTTMISWNFLQVTNPTVFNRFNPLPPTVGVNWSRSESKRRLRANPFGFQASTPGQLSASQFAILGALGLSKGGR